MYINLYHYYLYSKRVTSLYKSLLRLLSIIFIIDMSLCASSYIKSVSKIYVLIYLRP